MHGWIINCAALLAFGVTSAFLPARGDDTRTETGRARRAVLVSIAPGTVVGDRPPRTWSHLVIKSIPRLASGDLEGLVRAGQLASHAVAPIQAVIEQSGTRLIPLPSGWWQDEGAVMFPVGDPDDWCALLPLWTREIGRGPLWLEVDLSSSAGDLLAVVERVFLSRATS